MTTLSEKDQDLFRRAFARMPFGAIAHFEPATTLEGVLLNLGRFEETLRTFVEHWQADQAELRKYREYERTVREIFQRITVVEPATEDAT